MIEQVVRRGTDSDVIELGYGTLAPAGPDHRARRPADRGAGA